MGEVSIRELRNRGGEVLDRVSRGETLTVTRDGRPVAELRPLSRRSTGAAVLLERWRGLPSVDASRFRSDVDAIMRAEV